MMGRIRSTRGIGWRVGLCIAASILLRPALAEEPSLPVATFFANAEISDVRLSPSGRYLALSVPASTGRRALAVVDTGAEKPPVIVASSTRADVGSFEWVNDERLVYWIVDLKVAAYDQVFGPNLYSVKRDGSEARFSLGSDLLHGVALLKMLRDGSDDVIVGEYLFGANHELLSVVPKRLDVTTGRARSLAFGAPPNAFGWVFDAKGEARALVTRNHGVSEVFWRDGAETWRSLMKAPSLSMPWVPLAVDGAGHLYVVARGADSTRVLTRFDVANGKLDPEPIVSTPGFDGFDTLVFDDSEQRVIGVQIDTDAETSVWFTTDRKKLQALADARFPDRVNRTVCARCNEGGAMLVYSYSDRDPGTYSVYRPSTGEWTSIGRVRPAVDPKQMATLDLHRIKARDGLDLPVWVTTPRGPTTTPRPAVVLVHGGPWVRGTHWRWSADAQFLASRGYVVLEPEFRGSEGFGDQHLRAGFKKWGTAMQDDVADAVRWAAEKRIIDGKRVCIAGASYGGYATLMGSIRYPGMYRCGVAWVAVTDPRLLFESIWRSDSSRESREYSLPTMIGDPVQDAAMLKEATPVERAREIRVPMLLAFGAEDVRVPIDHADRIRAAMRASGNEPEFIVYSGEGHGWFKVENRIDFWSRVEKFLAKNLN